MMLCPDGGLRGLMFPNAFEVIRGPRWVPGGEGGNTVCRSEVTSVCVSKQSRFGNSVKQFRNAVNLASHLGVRNLYLPSFTWIVPGESVSEAGFNIVNDAGRVYADESTILIGRLFFDVAGIDRRHKRSAFDVIRQHKDILSLPVEQASLPEGHLVIHIRSGDVFVDPVPVRYGQLPLSFYLRVIESRDWRSIYLVAEDERNPVIRKLLELLSRRPGFSACIGRTLEEDLALLFRATNLVVSNGTFCRAISAISGNLKNVYTFEGKYDRWGNRGVEVFNFIDKGRVYANAILDGNWKNNAEQLELMLTYPEREIEQERQPLN